MSVVPTTFEDPNTLAAWTHLYESGGQATGSWFQNPDWHRLWWQYFGDPLTHSRLLLLRIEDETGPIAIAPLVLYSRNLNGFHLWRVVRFLGTPLTPYADIIVQAENAKRAWNAIFEYLARNLPDAWCEFDEVLLGHSLHHAGGTIYRTQRRAGETYLSIDLSQNEGSDNRHSAGLSKSIKRWESDRRYRWLFVLGYDESLSETMIRHNLESFREQSFFTSATNRAFLESLCKSRREDVWYAVAIHEEPVSILMGFKHGATLHHFMSGTSRQLEDPNMRLGLMNQYHLLGYMQNHGYEKFDMLRGKEEYKYHFHPDETIAEKWTLLPPRSDIRYRAARFLQAVRRHGEGSA